MNGEDAANLVVMKEQSCGNLLSKIIMSGEKHFKKRHQVDCELRPFVDKDAVNVLFAASREHLFQRALHER